MKTLSIPHKFASQSGLSAEDFNENFHHLVREIENLNTKRYGYSSLRIPFGVFSEAQKIGLNPATGDAAPGGGGTRPGGEPFWTPRRLFSKNHEAIRTFSFSPPYDVRVTRVETMVVSSGTNTVQVSYVTEPGGEGYPPRKESVLPIGFTSDNDPDMDKLHPISIFDIESDAVDETVIVTSNQEYLLKAGKVYRIQISSPKEGTYFKKAYVDLTLQYDRFQGQDPKLPDLDFVNASDEIRKAEILTNLNNIYDHMSEAIKETRTMKPELYYFGLGQMNGRWKRPKSPNAVANPTDWQSTMQSYTNITAGLNSTDEVWDDNETFKFICDFEQFYFNNAVQYQWTLPNYRTLITEMAIDFFSHSTFRAPMAPVLEQFDELTTYNDLGGGSGFNGFSTYGLNKKVVLGYTLGILHNSTYHHCMFTDIEGGFHYGLDYFGSLGHGMIVGGGTGPTNMTQKPHFWAAPTSPRPSSIAAPYQVARSSEYYSTAGGDPIQLNFIAPRLNNDANNPPTVPNGWESAPDIVQPYAKTDTLLGSTSIPSCVQTSDILNTLAPTVQPADETTVITGKATGFPGDYLAEIHAKTPVDINKYSVNAGRSENTFTGLLSTSVGTFEDDRTPVNMNANLSTRTNDILIDLFIQIMTQLPNSGRNVATQTRDASMMYRHLQKMYMILWVG